jgi:hypothetical protein
VASNRAKFLTPNGCSKSSLHESSQAQQAERAAASTDRRLNEAQSQPKQTVQKWKTFCWFCGSLAHTNCSTFGRYGTVTHTRIKINEKLWLTLSLGASKLFFL